MNRSLKRGSIATAGIAVVALSVGGVALADAAPSPSSSTVAVTTSPSPSATAGHGAAKAPGIRKAHRMARRALHVQWVTAAKDGAFVTHDAIRGQITAVSATSITVRAKDGVSQTYAVNSATRVRLRDHQAANGQHGKTGKTGKAGKAASGTIAQAHVGNRAAVVGTGTDSLTATRIIVAVGAAKAG